MEEEMKNKARLPQFPDEDVNGKEINFDLTEGKARLRGHGNLEVKLDGSGELRVVIVGDLPCVEGEEFKTFRLPLRPEILPRISRAEEHLPYDFLLVE